VRFLENCVRIEQTHVGEKQMILVSACLAGFNCRFNRKSHENDKVIQLVKDGLAIPVCPEQLGGLPTPRNPAEITPTQKVLSANNEDFTEAFVRGARETLRICKLYGCQKAILKSRSPSCGSGKIYDGSFTKTVIEGDGITTKLLKENGIEVINESEV